jgi:hypothetical protein
MQLLVPHVEAVLALLQARVEGVRCHPVELLDVVLGETPEALYPVDVARPLSLEKYRLVMLMRDTPPEIG